MSISLSGGYNTFFPVYSAMPVDAVKGANPVSRGSEGIEGTGKTDELNPRGKVKPEECQTCKNRKYVDGSTENDVSFKTPGHIDPAESGAKVMAHEKQHVANAVQEGNKPNKKLLSSSVMLKTAVCPECGRVYVSGGLTRTRIQTTNGDEKNPYMKQLDKMNKNLLSGMNFDVGA